MPEQIVTESKDIKSIPHLCFEVMMEGQLDNEKQSV
jgi:hypothetical protein